jgi:hypothetical protein
MIEPKEIQMNQSESKKDLNEVAGIPDALQGAYKASIAFKFSSIGDSGVADGMIERMANQEATVDSLPAGDGGITAGLKGVLRQRTIASLSSWLEVRREFDSSIQPYMDKINAVRNAAAKKEAIEKRAAEAEHAIVTEAEAHRPYADSKSAKVNADLHYDQLIRGEGGRPVTTFGNTWWYLLVMAGITSVEWLINYDAFFSWTGIPAIAAGFTIAMAIAVGFAAHIHGEYLKQRGSRFAPHSTNQGRDISFLATATFLLLLAVFVAGWARYSLAIHSITAQGPTIATDQVPQQQNPLTDVYVSLGINLIVWLIGLVVSYISHDENHELMDASLERWRTTRRFNRLHKPWEKRIHEVKAKATRELQQLSAATALDMASTKVHRDMLDQVEKREEAIYRSIAGDLQPIANFYCIELGRGLQDSGYKIIVNGQPISGRQYQQLQVNLSPPVLRGLLS